MSLQIGDYVKVPHSITNTNKPGTYYYGEIVGFAHQNSFITLRLTTSQLVRIQSFPKYLAQKISEDEYIKFTKNDWAKSYENVSLNVKPMTKEGCSHKWEKTGMNPVTGEEWFNCKKCSIPKEES